MSRRNLLTGALVTATLAAALLTTAGCSANDDDAVASSADRGTVGVALPTKTSTRWIADGDNMVKQFELLGYKIDMQYADNVVADQVSQLDAMIERGDKALVVSAVDGSALKDVLAKAAAKHIPVIAYDRLIRDSPNVDYYASFDNFKVGVLQAGYIVDALGLNHGKKGPYTIELFAGSSDDNNATLFFNGSKSVLQPYISSGTLEVKSGQTSFAKVSTQRWDAAVAKARMQRLLSGPLASDRLDAVLSPYDGISRGIIDALKAAGYGGAKKMPIVTGQDAELDSVKLMIAGVQRQTVYKDTRELAKVAVQMVNSLLAGGEPDVNDTTQYNNGIKTVPSFLLQPIGVDKSNYRRILIDGGYYTAAQIDA